MYRVTPPVSRRGNVKLFEGVRVLDLSRMLAGPYGSMLLADMGAEVIKIEDPDGGDPMRVMGPPFLADGESAYFLAINRNKKSVALDLARDAGRAVFYDLVRRADIVWENFRPGVMERLGCAYSKLWSLNQRVILCSISDYGQEGPYRDWPVFAEKFWSGFCRVVEHPEWERDLRFTTNRDRVANRDVLVPLVEAAFRRRTTDDWLGRLQAEGVPCAPIRSVDRVLADPQVRQRGMVAEMAHPVHGKLPALGTPVKVDGAMGLEAAPPPRLGEHTDLVLGKLLDYGVARIAELRATGVVL